MTTPDVRHERYTIGFEPDLRLVTVARRGLWTVETFESYERDLRRILAGVQAMSRDFLGLIDLRAQTVQTREVAERFRGLIAEDRLQPVRVAVVTMGALAKLQAGRVGRTTQRVFTDKESARAWLLDPSDS